MWNSVPCEVVRFEDQDQPHEPANQIGEIDQIDQINSPHQFRVPGRSFCILVGSTSLWQAITGGLRDERPVLRIRHIVPAWQSRAEYHGCVSWVRWWSRRMSRPIFSWMPLRGVRGHHPPGLLSSTAGAGVLLVRRGGGEREKAGWKKGRTPRDSIHELIEYVASHVPHLKGHVSS